MRNKKKSLEFKQQLLYIYIYFNYKNKNLPNKQLVLTKKISHVTFEGKVKNIKIKDDNFRFDLIFIYKKITKLNLKK